MAFLKTLGRHFRREIRPIQGLWLLAILLSVVAPWIAHSEPPGPPSAEYQVKAVFLFNFAQFVQWPTKAFADEKTPFVIGLLGTDPFGAYLDRLTAGEKIGSRSFVVERYRSFEDIPTRCQILFISRSETGQLDQILHRLKGRSVLTVSDAEDFNRSGGMIRFVTENGKIRLRVNVMEAKESGLTISSKLLRPATIVTREKG